MTTNVTLVDLTSVIYIKRTWLWSQMIVVTSIRNALAVFLNIYNQRVDSCRGFIKQSFIICFFVTFVRSLILWRIHPLIHTFTQTIVHLFIVLIVYSFEHSSVRPFVCSSNYLSMTHLSIHCLTHLLIQSVKQSINLLIICLSIHSFLHYFIHLFTHPFITHLFLLAQRHSDCVRTSFLTQH